MAHTETVPSAMLAATLKDMDSPSLVSLFGGDPFFRRLSSQAEQGPGEVGAMCATSSPETTACGIPEGKLRETTCDIQPPSCPRELKPPVRVIALQNIPEPPDSPGP